MNPANYSVISFPFLGLEMNPPRYFSIGSLDIHLYGVVIALGLFLAVLYAQKRCTSVGITPDYPLCHCLRPDLLLRLYLGILPG